MPEGPTHRRLSRFLAFLLVGCVLLGQWVPQASASSIYVLDAILKLQDGKILAGVYDVRLSLWRQKMPTAADLKRDSKGHEVLNIQSENFTGFSEEHVVTSASNGSFSLAMGRLVELDPIFEDGTSYLQVDVKPSGADQSNWQRVILPDTKNMSRRAIVLSDLQSTRIRFEANYGTYSGVLMDKDSKPETGNYVARFSLWGSANMDKDFDSLPDGSIRSASSNYLGYNLELPFTADKFGRFVLHVGPFNSEFIQRDKNLFMQLEIRKADELMSQYDLIDPDGKLDSDLDRYPIKDGKLVAQDQAALQNVGETEKFMVANIPGGTTSRSFELGVGDALPVGYYEIRVRQADGKAASLRFNAVEKRWEVSSDGIVFSPIATFLKGTPEKKFTIGLGDAVGNDTLRLQFGDTLKPGRLAFDPQRDVFIINKSVDFLQHQLLNAVLHNSATPPPKPVAGQEYYNTTDKQAYFYNGSAWIAMGVSGSASTTGSNSGASNTFMGNPSFNITPAPASTTVINNNSMNATWDNLAARDKSFIFDGEALSAAMIPATAGTKGTIEELHDDTADKNFYRWTTKQTSMQQMQLMLEWTAPEDFLGFAAQPITIMLRTPSNNPADAKVDLIMQKNNTPMAMTGATDMTSPAATDWQTSSLSFSGTPVILPGERVTIVVTLGVTGGMTADLGSVTVHYKGK